MSVDEDAEHRSQLRQEAAAWFARMRGPDAGRHRAEFEQWLARGALHRGAYNRIAEIFSAGKRLKDFEPPRPKRRTKLLFVATLLLIAGIALAGIVHLLASDRIGSTSSNDAQLVSVIGQVRHISLSDGSRVTLDSDSLVVTRFDAETRLLQLRRGRARFDVRHEQRPFVVVADDTRITARGTVFDVSIRAAEVDVDLLRGVVEVVRRPDERRTVPAGRPIVLHAGQEITRRADGTFSPPARRADRPSWVSRLAAFDRTPLTEVVAQANRYGIDKIIVDDPTIAKLTVSGTFRINDTAQLAERLAALFDLEVDSRTPGRIVLSRRLSK